MRTKRPLISDEWAREYHKDDVDESSEQLQYTSLTFCGVLEEFYSNISRFWNDETKRKYDRDYNSVILPHITGHNEKVISQYNVDECEKIIIDIQEDGFISRGEKKDYSKMQINHFRRLVKVVFEQAISHGYCKDFLWGTKFGAKKDDEELIILSKTKIKKSLSIVQEKKFIAEVMSNTEENGKLVALLLMFSLGIRDGEACGLDYGDIYELPNYMGNYVAIIKQTTIPNTNILQSSGKTINTGRKIPIPPQVVKFLLKRKESLAEKIASMGVDLDINKLPIAGLGALDDDVTKISTRLKADDVTKTARKVFQAIGILPELLGALEIEMENELAKLEVKESNVTAYLLRRNYATHLKILGFEYPDIQYLLGHSIEDRYTSRTDYSNSKLHSMCKKMANRPLVGYVENKNEVFINSNSESYFSGNKKIIANVDFNYAHIKIFCVEKNDVLKINVSDGSRVTANFYKGFKSYDFHRELDVIKKYISNYGG